MPRQGALAFGQFGLLHPDLAQLGDGFLAAGGLQLQYRQLDLGDPPLGLGGAGLKLSESAQKPRILAPQGQRAGGLGEAAIDQVLHVDKFLGDQALLFLQCDTLCGDPADLRPDLIGAAAQLVDLLRQCLTTRLEEVALPLQHLAQVVIALGGLHDIGGEHHLLQPVAFGHKPGTAGAPFGILRVDHGQVGLDDRAVEAQHDIALGHQLPLIDHQRGDDAPLGVLHRLPVLVDLDLARCHDRARDVREHGPGPEAADQQQERRHPQKHRPAHRPGLLRRIPCHQLIPPGLGPSPFGPVT